MHFAITFLLTQLALGSTSLAQNNPSYQLAKRDHHHVKRSNGSFSGRATFYSTGLGACGDTNTDSDFIVALNAPQYTANKWCGKKIKIKFGKKSTTAVIKDECPGCPFGGLDMSPSLFEYFASKDVGVFYMNWSLDDGSSDDSPPAPPPPPPPPAPSPSPPPPPPPAPKPLPTLSPKPNDSKPDPPPSYDSDDNILNNTQPPTVGGNKPFSGNNTPANQKLPPTPTTTPVTSFNSPTVHQGSYIQPSQPNSPYAPGGNLDAINQLVISFGSLAAASADNALNKQT